MDTRLIHDSWRKGSPQADSILQVGRDERTKARGGRRAPVGRTEPRPQGIAVSGVGSPASASGRSCVFCGARAWRRSAASWARQRLGWREAFLRGGEAALKARPADERDEENARLKAKVGELTMEGEVLREKIDRLEAGRPLAGVEAAGRAYAPFGGAPRSTRNGGERRSPFMNAPRPISAALWARAPIPRPHPAGPGGLSLHGEGYRKVWARLRFAGIRTSKERVRRLMREAGLQAPHRVGKPRGPKAHNGTIRERPDRMWGTHDDDGDHRGGDGLGVRGGGSLLGGLRGDPCGQERQPLRGPGADRGSPSASPAWRRTSPRGQVRHATAPPICPMTFSGRSPTWA